MAGRKNPPAKWVLPTVIDPTEKLCTTIFVPNDPYHIAAFRGALLNLQSAYKWADDSAHTAKDVALVWRAIIDEIEWGGELPFDVRQNTENPCTLEKTVDEGVTWDAWANLQLCPPKIRIDRGKPQWFNPSTGLWENVPDSGDEREDGTYDPPYPPGTVPPGQSAQCLSAENILSVYSTVFTQMRADVVLGKYVSAIAAGALGLLGAWIEPALISAVALSLAAGAFALAEAGLNDMLSSDTLETLRCNLFCHASSDGSFTAENYAEFYAQLSEDFTSLKLTVLQYYFDCLGPVGLSRQGKANGIETADCSDCDCGPCVVYDFTIENWGFNGTNSANSAWGDCDYGGVYVGSTGWQTQIRSNAAPCNVYANEQVIEKVFSGPLAVAYIKITYTWATSHTSGGFNQSVGLKWGNGSFTGTQLDVGVPSGPHAVDTITIGATIDRISVIMLESYSAGNIGTIEKIEIFCE